MIGAVFNSTQQAVFNWRKDFHNRPRLRYLEVISIVTLMTFICYGVPALWDTCTPIPTVSRNNRGAEQEFDLIQKLVPLYCPKGTHYNQLASLFLTDADTCIRQLYHFREEGKSAELSFSSSALFLFFLPYIVMSCITFGSGVPAGTFVPSLVSGAAFGRLVGHILHKLDNLSGTFADSGTYALMGSAAVTGGITRLTISLVVVILEATGDMQYVLPLMLVVMSAVFVGRLFTPGLYDIYISNRQLRFLEEEESLSKDLNILGCNVSQIMVDNPTNLEPVMQIGDLLDILSSCSYHCFPVVENRLNNVLVGTISRKVLCGALLYQHSTLKNDGNSSRITWSMIESTYPHYSDIDEIMKLSSINRSDEIDLIRYVDNAPHSINMNASVQVMVVCHFFDFILII